MGRLSSDGGGDRPFSEDSNGRETQVSMFALKARQIDQAAGFGAISAVCGERHAHGNPVVAFQLLMTARAERAVKAKRNPLRVYNSTAGATEKEQ